MLVVVVAVEINEMWLALSISGANGSTTQRAASAACCHFLHSADSRRGFFRHFGIYTAGCRFMVAGQQQQQFLGGAVAG